MLVGIVTASIRPAMASNISSAVRKISTPCWASCSSPAVWFSGSITAVATISQAPRWAIGSR
jgi:hypothetical protein